MANAIDFKTDDRRYTFMDWQAVLESGHEGTALAGPKITDIDTNPARRATVERINAELEQVPTAAFRAWESDTAPQPWAPMTNKQALQAALEQISYIYPASKSDLTPITHSLDDAISCGLRSRPHESKWASLDTYVKCLSVDEVPAEHRYLYACIKAAVLVDSAGAAVAAASDSWVMNNINPWAELPDEYMITAFEGGYVGFAPINRPAGGKPTVLCRGDFVRDDLIELAEEEGLDIEEELAELMETAGHEFHTIEEWAEKLGLS